MIDLFGRIILFGMVSPLIALPSFLWGWMVRRWWLVPIGAAVLAALFIVVALIDLDRPEDSEIVWSAAPASLVPPLAWCAAGYFFGRWRRGRGGYMPAGFGRVVSILGGLLLGAVAGATAGFGLGLAYVELAHVSSFEGLAGYVVVFLFALPGLVIGAILGAVIGGIVNRRLGAQPASAA
jgi:hypothetical protein